MTEVKRIKASELTPDIRNANRGTERGRYALEASLREYGVGRSIVVDKHGRIIGGNKTLETAAEIGLDDVLVVQTDGTQIVAVQRMDLDLAQDDKARMLAYADNRVGQLDLDFDPEIVAEDIASGLDLSAFWQDFELDEIMAPLQPETTPGEDTEPQVDKAEELRQKWGVKTGQLWQMGEHRLICGDCTDAEVVERVMGGERAALSVTSPPYAVGKEYETGGVDEWRELIRNCFAVMLNCASDVWFVNLANRRTGNDGYEENTFGLMESEFRGMGVRLIGLRLWIKDPAWAGQNPYWLQTYKPVDDFEFLGIFAKQKPKHKKRLTDDEYKSWGWRGVWELASVRANDLHSAMFPVEIPERAVKMMTDNADIVYEPFSGSGTTIIACENLGRRCRAVEISPGYVAVALERWHQHTGKTPVLIETDSRNS